MRTGSGGWWGRCQAIVCSTLEGLVGMERPRVSESGVGTMGRMKASFSAVSLFAGCGGSDLGLRQSGVEVVFANEKNASACEFYERVTGSDVMEHADIRDIDEFPSAEILVGCYPCQGYSQGGKRDSAAGINLLYREFDRALRKVRPLAFVVENVNGMRFSSNSPLLRAQLVRFRSAGYRVSWKVLDAKDFGLAQDRKRLFMVGIRSSEGMTYEFPCATHGEGPNRSPYVTLREQIWHLRNAPLGSFNDEPFHWYYLSRNRRRTWGQQAPCVVARSRHVALHPSSPPLRRVGPDEWIFTREGRARRFSYLECAALQGFPDPDAFGIGSVSLRIRAIGNAVPPPLFGAVTDELVKQLRSPRSQSESSRRSHTPAA